MTNSNSPDSDIDRRYGSCVASCCFLLSLPCPKPRTANNRQRSHGLNEFAAGVLKFGLRQHLVMRQKHNPHPPLPQPPMFLPPLYRLFPPHKRNFQQVSISVVPRVFGRRKRGSQVITLRFSTRHQAIQCEEACIGSWCGIQ